MDVGGGVTADWGNSLGTYLEAEISSMSGGLAVAQ